MLLIQAFLENWETTVLFTVFTSLHGHPKCACVLFFTCYPETPVLERTCPPGLRKHKYRFCSTFWPQLILSNLERAGQTFHGINTCFTWDMPLFPDAKRWKFHWEMFLFSSNNQRWINQFCWLESVFKELLYPLQKEYCCLKGIAWRWAEGQSRWQGTGAAAGSRGYYDNPGKIQNAGTGKKK